MIGLLKELLMDGYCFTSSVNEFYIPNKEFYHKRYFKHGLMVYGFDDETKILDIAGFDMTWKFNTGKVSYEEYEKAFMTCKVNERCTILKRKNLKYHLDTMSIKWLLEDYIGSKNTTERLRILANPLKGCMFGQEAFLAALELKDNIDYRDLYTIYEHKKVMVSRLTYLAENLKQTAFIEKLDCYSKITGKVYGLLLYCLKNIKNNVKSDKVYYVSKIKELLKEEKDILQNVIEHL